MLLKRIGVFLLTICFFIIESSMIPVYAANPEAVNLVRGLPYKIDTGEPMTHSYLHYEPDKYNIDNGQLTDGVTAMTDYSSSAWYCAMRGVSRIVTFDFGELMSVSGFSAGFLHIKNMAIYAPRYVNVMLSEDGENYQTVCRTSPDFDITDVTTRRADIAEDFKNCYWARYAKVEYCCDIFAYCDEIRIFGTQTKTGSERRIKPDEKTNNPGYLMDIAGVKNIIKIYNGYYEEQSVADNTAEELLPYIAYVQSDGSYTDTMFDSVAFVPCHTDYPSGGRLVKTNGKNGAVMSDWLLYLENTFKQGINCDALNTVVGEVYSRIGKKGRLTVFFTLPYPTVISGAFGDIDGDGIDEKCTTLEERTDILKWFINLTYSTFKKAGYENLNFGGFYWYRESIDYYETDHEQELINRTSTYLTSRKFKFIYDPFYLSTGFDHWKELGFDAAVMQPNLVFRDYFEPEMLGEFAVTINKHNLGIEIETGEPGSFVSDKYKEYGLTYERYLYYGLQTGYMSSLHTFYQGAGPGTIYNFCKAEIYTEKGNYLRSLYDKTYRFIKETYTANTPAVEIPDFTTTSGQKNARIAMKITDSDTLLGDISVIFTKEPEHGTVTALPNKKSIVFTAQQNYSGIDTFEVVVYDNFTYSEPLTVTVTIVDTTESSNGDSTVTDNESSIATRTGGNGRVWIILAAAGLIMIGGTVTVLYFRKKANKSI
ncbi:MAG: DUF4855 domain-containing protein [Eubacteriales bacterium]|nr:DUF4855 domain-containing protein [Eubacteriales bacterium]